MTGFASPNHTQTPNDLFDVLLAQIDTLAELKVTLAVIRKTLGYHKKKDPISFTQLQKITGMNPQAVQSGIEKAVERGTIEVVGKGARGVNIFALVMHDHYENHSSDYSENHSDKRNTQNKKDSPSGDGVSNSKPGKTKAERPRNPMYDAIKDVWGYTAARNGQMAAVLNGTSTKKGYAEYNLEIPITPDELRTWAKWWKDRNPGINLVEELIKVQSSITAWQELTANGSTGSDSEFDAEMDKMFETMDVVGGAPWEAQS